MSAEPQAGFEGRLARLGLPHLGGMDVLFVGPLAHQLVAFAAFQRASAVESVASIDGSSLAPGTYDVVVWLHDSPECVIEDGRLARVVSLLNRQGLLVLESALETRLAPDTGPRTQPANVMDRGALEAGLADYAVKLVGAPSAPALAGRGPDVVVHHVAMRRPVVCLMMAPPGWGKSSLARQIFADQAASLPVIAADSLIHRIAREKVPVDVALREAIQEGFSPLRIDQAVYRIMERGQLAAWVDAVVAAADGRDFVLEGFVPADHQRALQEAFRDCGYLPVRMEWDREHPAPMDAERADSELRRFQASLAAGNDAGAGAAITPGTVAGNIDAMSLGPQGVTLRGWAVTATGHRPRRFEVRHGREVLKVLRIDVEDRPDVRDHLELPHGRIGFRLLVQAGTRKLRSPGTVSVKVADEQGEWHGPLHRSG